MDQAQASIETVEVDVVVIGGGIQGLWVLGDLIDAGYNAILLERMRPGFGQTGHSHVFLHQGHIYAGMAKPGMAIADQDVILNRIKHVQQANGIWQQEMRRGRLKGLQPITSTFYMAFSDAGRGEDFKDLCKRSSLTCDEPEVYPAEFGSMTQRLYQADGTCLDSNLLLTRLLQSGNLTERVGLSEIVSVQLASSGRFHLMDKEKSLRIDAGAVVLSAGSGNEHLQGLFGLDALTNGSKQQTVKTFMLIIGEIKESLPASTGMHLDFDGLFLVSRKDSTGRTVWLIGDKQRKLVAVPGEISAFDPVTWFRRTRLALDKLFPKVIRSPDDYEWGIYEAAKAEPWTQFGPNTAGKFPGTYHFKRVPGLPVWLAWPTLLTFAPLVARLIVQDLATVVKPKTVATDWLLWNDFRIALAPENCRWKITPLLSWKDFERCYA